jgi:hypothetical protein
METQHFKIDKEQIHFAQTLLKVHMWEWWMSQKQETSDLLETIIREEFKLWLDKRFTSHHFMFQDGMELLELTEGDDKSSLVAYVQKISSVLFLTIGEQRSVVYNNFFIGQNIEQSGMTYC